MILCVCLSPAIDVTYRVNGLAVGGTNRAHAVAQRAGGKGVNVARVLHSLGEETAVLAPSGGPAGVELAADLSRCGVASELIPNGAPTRRTVTVLEESTGVATMLAEPAEIDCWPALIGRAKSAIRSAHVIVISGAIPHGAPPDAMPTLVELARWAGRPVIVDTSGPSLVAALSARPTVVKPNADELVQACAGDDPFRAACTLARTHRTTVIASLGADGLIAATEHEAWRARPARALTGNPTGAGDALVAGLARGLRRGSAFADMLADSVALSAAAVLSPHAGTVDPAHFADQRTGVLVQPVELVR